VRFAIYGTPSSSFFGRREYGLVFRSGGAIVRSRSEFYFLWFMSAARIPWICAFPKAFDLLEDPKCSRIFSHGMQFLLGVCEALASMTTPGLVCFDYR